MSYANYRSLTVTVDDLGIAEVVLGEPGRLPTADAAGHAELARLWRDLDADPAIAVIVVRGQARGFSGGGSLDLVQAMADSDAVRQRVWREARAIVFEMIECSKVIVSAIHGPAVGAGLAVALLADISVAARDARLMDGHTRLGVAAGDHAAIVWPLLCGMARSKLHLLLSDEISGAEAERIGLVSMAVEPAQLDATVTQLAQRLARGPQQAQRATKHALNGWLRQAGPIFEHSLALEMAGFGGPEMREGLAALRERRAPDFIRARKENP